MSLMDDIKALAGEVKAPFTGMRITQGASHQDRRDDPVPGGAPPDAAPRPLAARPQPLRERPGKVHRLLALRRGLPRQRYSGRCGREHAEENRRSPGERFAEQYEINMLRCIFCGYCEEACPTQAIQLKDICELAESNSRRDHLHQRNDAGA